MLKANRIAAVALTVVLSAIWGVESSTAQSPDDAGPKERTITVTGTGKASANADLAVIIVAVNAEGSFAQDALASLRNKMRDMTAALHDAGVPEADIVESSPRLTPRFSPPAPASPQLPATSPSGAPASSFSITTQPRQSPPPQAPMLKPDGFRASVTLRINKRSLADLGEFIDRIADHAGGQQPIEFLTVEDPQRLLEEARLKALDNAEHLAQIEAQHMHLKLGAVRAIRDQPLQSQLAAMGTVVRPVGAPEALPTAIEPQPTVSANVEVQWALEP